MKSVAAALLVALLAFGLGLYLPWWTIALAAAVVALVLDLRPAQAFLAGLTGAMILWGMVSFLRSSANEHILAHRMSRFILQKDSPELLILVTALIGGLTGGMGALTGSLFRNLVRKPRN
jgi:hypothetical protein